MKNVQVIDGAENATYSIFAFTDEEFGRVFTRPLQDIAFIEDVKKRLGKKDFDKTFADVWNRPVEKKNVSGIDGTLFYELINKKKYYPTKKECEMISLATGRIVGR